MMGGRPPNPMVHYLAHSLASDVIGFAANRLSEMLGNEEKETMRDWDKEDYLTFFKSYLRFLTDAYTVQIKAINKGTMNVKCDAL